MHRFTIGHISKESSEIDIEKIEKKGTEDFESSTHQKHKTTPSYQSNGFKVVHSM